MRRVLVGVVIAGLCAGAAWGLEDAAGLPIEQTRLIWQTDRKKPGPITLYGDGRVANTRGETGSSRWMWTANGLLVQLLPREFLLRVGAEPGTFEGVQVNPWVDPGEVPRRMRARIEGPDGAGVLAWTVPILDGVRPSALERQADVEATQVVADRLAAEWARVEAAWWKAANAEGALLALDAEMEVLAEHRETTEMGLAEAKAKARKYQKWTWRTIDPYYSYWTFATALRNWQEWELRRDAAERNLDRAEEAISSAKDRRARAAAEVRRAAAEYEVAGADYYIRFGTLWRPEYQRRKEALKTEAALKREAAEALRQAHGARAVKEDKGAK